MGIGNYNEECRSIVMKCELTPPLDAIFVVCPPLTRMWRWFEPSFAFCLALGNLCVHLLV